MTFIEVLPWVLFGYAVGGYVGFVCGWMARAPKVKR